MKYFILCVLTLLISTSVYSEVYKWVDDEGKVHYSDKSSVAHSEIITVDSIKAPMISSRTIRDFKFIRHNDEKYRECLEDLLQGETFEEYKALCKEAAIMGAWYAQYKIGNGYFADRTLKFDVLKAITWFESSSTGKYEMAMYNLGLMYAHGNPPVEKNLELALDLIKRGKDANPTFAKQKIAELELELQQSNNPSRSSNHSIDKTTHNKEADTAQPNGGI